MMRVLIGVNLLLLMVALYFLMWPVPIEPVAWQAPDNAGYSGPFTRNRQLQGLSFVDLAGSTGPEDMALSPDGQLYISTHEGLILRHDMASNTAVAWVETGGMPLGIAFAPDGRLIVADAARGLLAVDSNRHIETLVVEVNGQAPRYVNHLDVSKGGIVYFTDSSSKFAPIDWGGTYPASLLDLMEHGGHGRVLSYNLATGDIAVLLDNLNFPNGVALSADEQSLLIAETGGYRVLRYWLAGSKAGQTDDVLAALPGFPDNLERAGNHYWLGLASPRNRMLDDMASKPFMRKIVQRLPAGIRPEATHHGHVIAFDDNGRILHDLQDPEGDYAVTTSALEAGEYLYVGSLVANQLGRIPISELERL